MLTIINIISGTETNLKRPPLFGGMHFTIIISGTSI